MAPTHGRPSRSTAEERIRDRVLSALHVSRLRPGDRVPSVRRLADLTGLNHKTIHRAYRTLARDGFLDVRPGSGTFVSERHSNGAGRPRIEALLGIVERARQDGARHGLTSTELARFLSTCLDGGLHSVRLALVECNRDQLGMMRRDVEDGLGVRARAIVLDDLDGAEDFDLAGMDCIVTTDCHYPEVARRFEGTEIPVHAVAFDANFPRELLKLSHRSELALVSRDERFGRVILRLLDQLAPEAASLRRIRVIGERSAGTLLAGLAPGATVYVSPTVSSSVRRNIPSHLETFKRCWHVEHRSLEALRVALALRQVRRT